MNPARAIWPVRLPAFTELVFSGRNGGAALRAAAESFIQGLALEIDGARLTLQLDGMDVHWQGDGFVHGFAIEGPGIALAGAFPKGTRVGCGEDWRVLIGKAIPLAGRRRAPAGTGESFVTVPGARPMRVLGGCFTLENVRPGRDEVTPLTGTVVLRLRGPAGESTLCGAIAVNATTRSR